MSSGRRSDVAAFAGLVLVVLFLFRSAVFGGEAIFERDTAFWYYPQADDVVRILTSGSLPFWNPHRGFGEPLLAIPSNQILYPPMYLHLLLEPWTCYTWYVVGHLTFSGLGMYWLARRLGLSALASFLSAGAWTASGPLLSMVNMWNHFSGATWVPWVFLAARRACQTLKTGDALLWGALVAIQAMTGSADMCAIAALCAVAGVLDRLHWSRPREPVNARWLTTVALAGTFAAALAAAQWLPALDLLRDSMRRELSLNMRTSWSVHPLAMVQVAVPFATKGLSLETSDKELQAETKNPLLSSLYLGVPVLGLAAVGLFGPRRPLRLFLACVLGVAVCVALGRHAPFYASLVALLPPLSILRHPVKAMILAPFASSLLGGMGLDALPAVATDRLRTIRVTVCCGLLALCCALAGGLALAGMHGHLDLPFRFEPQLFDNLALTARQALIASIAGLALAWILVRGPHLSSKAAFGLAAAALIELVSVTAGINPTAPIKLLAERPATVSAIAAAGADSGTRVYTWDYFQRVVGKKYPEPHVVDALDLPGPHGLARTLGLRMLYPFCGRWGLSGSFEADPLGLSPVYMRTLVLSFRAAEETPLFVRLLEMGGVSYVLALHREGLDELMPMASVPSPFGLPIQVFRVRDPLPRVYAVGVGRVVGRDAGYRALSDAGFDFRRHVLLADGPVVTSAGFAGTARVLETKPDRLRVEVDFNAPGYLVVSEAYARGWTATLDGQPAAVHRANVGFRAVPVPAGRHVVEQLYRPTAVKVGLLVSALALAAGLGVLLLSRTRGDAE